MSATALSDHFGRTISYLRLSVTDRCNLRCTYCMEEKTQFVPHQQILTLEETSQLVRIFAALGVNKVRITGGEPLVRKGIEKLFLDIAGTEGIDELTLTTNGTLLDRHLDLLKQCAVRRINISLDSLQAERFAAITRRDDFHKVVENIDRCVDADFTRIRLNTVVQKGINDDEAEALCQYAIDRGIDLAFIEHMPMGPMEGDVYYSNDALRKRLEQQYGILPSTRSTAGPATYFMVPNTDTRIGFISPMSHNFCERCNRVRLTAEGKLYPCLDGPEFVDLKAALRDSDGDDAPVIDTIMEAMHIKPKGHTFDTPDRGVPIRFMNHTGG